MPSGTAINALQTGSTNYVPIIGMLSPSYCTTALAQVNFSKAAYGPYTPSGANWCQVVNISSTYKELSLTLQNPAGIDTITVQPVSIAPTQVNQPVAGYFAVPDTVLADAVYDKATTQQLSPLFDYTEEYQSPAAIDAINQFNATAVEPFPTYTDITTPALGNPVKTSSTASPELPPFCGWATTICEFMAWVKEEPDEPDQNANKVNVKNIGISDIPELQNIDIDQKRVTFNAYCPDDINVPFNFMGSSQNLHFSYQPLCQLLTKIRPIVIASAYITGAYIVSGASRREG